ncbi:MAG: nucleotide exchange factor GrpE [Pseudomonadota bacterium]
MSGEEDLREDESASPADHPETPEPEAKAAAAPEAEAAAPPTPEDRIAELEAETADLKDKLLRSLAEVDNVRKRAQKQVSDERVYAIEKFAGDLLSVSDNLARALEAVTDEVRANLSEAGKGLLEGVEMTEKELHAVLARHGVKAIDAAPGAAFDPNQHQAVSQIPSEHPSGTVAAPFQSGWKIGERVLRAAMVAVSSGPAN